MASDPSIYAQSNRLMTPLLSPNQIATDTANTATAIVRNRLLQAGLTRDQLAQQSVNPLTGQVDVPGYQRLVAQTPEAGPGAMDAFTASQALATSQQGLAARNLGLGTSVLGSLMSDNGGAGPDFARVQQGLQQGVQSGALSQQAAGALMVGMPTGDDPQSRATRQHMLQTFNEQGQSPQQRLENVMGAPATMSDGQQMQPGMRGGLLGGAPGAFNPAGAPTQLYPSRAELLGQQPGVDANGNTTMTPLVDRANAQGRGALAGPAAGAPGAGPGGIPRSLMPPGYNGRYGAPSASPAAAAAPAGGPGAAPAAAPANAPPNAMDDALNRFRAVQNRVAPPTHATGPGPAMPALPTDPGSVGVPPVYPPPTQVPTSPGLSPAPASPPPPVLAVAQDGSVVTGIAPARRAALEVQGGESARAFQAIADQGTQARNQSAVLGTMLADTSAFQPGTTGANAFRAYVQRQAPAIARAFNIDPNQVAAAESFDKLGAQLLNAQGVGSDARLSAMQHATPNSGMSGAGVDLILRSLQGGADYTQARARLAAAHPDQTDRAGFEAGVGAQLDPRAFTFDRLTPTQQRDYVKGMSAADRARLTAAYGFARGQGLLASQGGGVPTAAPPPTPVAQPAYPAAGGTPRGF